MSVLILTFFIWNLKIFLSNFLRNVPYSKFFQSSFSKFWLLTDVSDVFFYFFRDFTLLNFSSLYIFFIIFTASLTVDKGEGATAHPQ